MTIDRELPSVGTFRRQRLPQGVAQPPQTGLGTRAAPQLCQVVFLRLLRHARGHPVAALPTPPRLLLVRPLPLAQLLLPIPLQVAERHQARLDPALHFGERAEAILGE